MWMGAILSGPSAVEAFEDLMADRTWFTLNSIGVSRLCRSLIVLRFALSEVKLVGFVSEDSSVILPQEGPSSRENLIFL